MLYIPKDPLAEYRPQHLSRGAAKESRFRVTIDGENVPVRLTRESKMPFNRVWPGYQRDLSQTEQGEYTIFFGDAPAALRIALPDAPELLEKAVLRPLRHGVMPVVRDGILELTLSENGYYSLECGSIHTSLQIFFCSPLCDDGGASADIRFDAGVHFPGKMRVHSGERIYIHPEAVVYGAILGEDVENVTVYGGGVLDDSTEERVFEDCYNPESSGCIRFFRSNHIAIRDVICLNASNWVISTFDCSEVHIDGVKILGQWRYNTDGIDLVNASHCSIRHCFVRSFDDTVVLKALYQYPCMEDITVEDCVLWCGWGKTLEIGLETSADEYRDIHYRRCDLIHNSHGALAISNGNYAHVHDVSYEDITIEYAENEDLEVYQSSDDMTYAGESKAAHADVFKLSNWRMWEAYPYIDIAGEKAAQYGHTDNISYRGIRVFTEDGTDRLTATILSCDPEVPIEGLTVEDFCINGEKQTSMEKLRVQAKYGTLPTVR